MPKVKLAALGLALALSPILVEDASASTCSLWNFTTSTDCQAPVGGSSGGNVSESEMNSEEVFGHNTWSLLDEISDAQQSNPIVSLGGLFEFTYTEFVLEDGKYEATAGTWRLLDPFTWGSGKYAFGIKAGANNAVYLMDTSFAFGTWDADDIDGFALSNVKLFGTDDLSQVPLPAAGWLMIAGLGGIVALKRKKKADMRRA